MKRFIAKFNTSEKNAEDIIKILKEGNIEIENYLKNIDVYILRSNSHIQKNKFLDILYEINNKFHTNEEE